jgi:hypothetical protein
MNKSTQSPLFPEFPEIVEETSTKTFQIKRFDDSNFVIKINVKEDEDPADTALEALGYFLVTETTPLYV